MSTRALSLVASTLIDAINQRDSYRLKAEAVLHDLADLEVLIPYPEHTIAMTKGHLAHWRKTQADLTLAALEMTAILAHDQAPK